MQHDDLIGTVIDGRYRVGEEIGEGAMGVVYRCRHVRLEKDIAIKILRRGHCRSEGVVRRFIKEARLASSLKHPNVVDLSDCGELEGGGAYYVMELLKGEALAETLGRERRIRPPVAFEIILQIAAGLKAAHNSEIVHRDLKPENVFLCPSGGDELHIKLLDFGIARAKDSKDTLPGTVLGTPEYMAPEQARGDAVDTRADLYALGVMLFEMLSGRVPLFAEDLGELINLKLHTTPPRLRQAAPDLSKMVATDAVIAKLLQRDPADRVQTIEEATTLIRDAMSQDLAPVGSEPTGRQTRGIGSGEVASPSPNTAYDRAVGGGWQRPGTRLPAVGQRPESKGLTVPAIKGLTVPAIKGLTVPASKGQSGAGGSSIVRDPVVAVPVQVSPPPATRPATRPGPKTALAGTGGASQRRGVAIPLLAVGATIVGALVAGLMVSRGGSGDDVRRPVPGSVGNDAVPVSAQPVADAEPVADAAPVVDTESVADVATTSPGVASVEPPPADPGVVSIADGTSAEPLAVELPAAANGTNKGPPKSRRKRDRPAPEADIQPSQPKPKPDEPQPKPDEPKPTQPRSAGADNLDLVDPF
ncbi:MAG: protein kinase [Nannocystaceae bacterium]|nr:protein kinase [Nannocystaceae bacterium]